MQSVLVDLSGNGFEIFGDYWALPCPLLSLISVLALYEAVLASSAYCDLAAFIIMCMRQRT